MPVGNQDSEASVNNRITSMSVQMRELMSQVLNLNMGINGQNTGLAYLQSIGFSGASNPANPGGISDAQYALNMIAYLNTLAGVYFGTATQTPAFNFNQELSQVWGGNN